MRQNKPQRKVMILHPEVALWVWRWKTAKKVWELPGAVRWVAADGHTWIARKWRSIVSWHGGGHKAKRRLGLSPDQDYDGRLEDDVW